MSEIEIKFVTQQNTLDAFKRDVAPRLLEAGVTLSEPQTLFLQNDYYDTPEQFFEKNKIGMRVRGCNGTYEQTVKTNGHVRAGLHERAEYNLPLNSAEPDITEFESDIWPEGFSPSEASQSLVKQFSTHFTRTAYDVRYDDALIELVFDNGEVTTEKSQSPICEIELELKDGDVARLFDLAKELMATTPMRLSDVSKAAQGYQLLHGVAAKIKPLPAFLPLAEDETTENAFCVAAEIALKHWQVHEHLYLETGAPKMLAEVSSAIRLLLQSVSLYLPVLQCPQLLAMHKQLLDYAETWLWQDDLQSLRYLQSKKSVFTKRLSRYPALLSYLQGRQAGILQSQDPKEAFFDGVGTAIKLAMSEILHEKPWREKATGYQLPVMEHAKGWLSQGWQTVQQSMPSQRQMQAANYIAVEALLRQTLFNGFLLAELFAANRGDFRAPWLDILTGIDELKALLLLRNSIYEAELEQQQEILEWAGVKIQNLLKVMERSRQVAMHSEAYW